jgi:hypothetical protein
LKQRIGRQQKLGENNNSTENRLVLQQVVTVRAGQNSPIFEPLVDALLSASYPLLNFFSSGIRLHNIWAFDVGWGGALIAPIRLAPSPLLQHPDQPIPENREVIPLSWGIRPAPPADAPRLDAECHLIPQTALLELVTPKGLRIALRNPEVGSGHREQTIFLDISLLPVFKFDLKGVNE